MCSNMEICNCGYIYRYTTNKMYPELGTCGFMEDDLLNETASAHLEWILHIHSDCKLCNRQNSSLTLLYSKRCKILLLHRTFPKPTALRLNHYYIIYYHNWAWVIVTGRRIARQKAVKIVFALHIRGNISHNN